MANYISSNLQKEQYKKGLQLLDIIIGEMKKENYPIQKNAAFILELEKMHEGIRTILNPTNIRDIFWGSFLAGEKDMIAFNYRSSIDIPPMNDEDYFFSTTLVLLNSKANIFYILTQHMGIHGEIYDLKYFNLAKKEVKIFDGIEDANSLASIFIEETDISKKVKMVKELTLQIPA